MISTEYKNSFKKSPLIDYLNFEGLKPCEFGIMAKTDSACVYDVIEGYRSRLPRTFVEAINERSGVGAGEAVAAAYDDYRETRRNILIKRKK